MPIIVKDYTWTQTAKMVNIRVPMKPGYHEKVDLFTMDSYIKAFFSPFIFEVFLLKDINSENSKCIVKDDLIVFDLVKREEIEWKCLEKDLTKPEKMQIKQEILEKCQEEARQKAEEKQIRKSQLDRFTVQQAMAIDSEHHELMDSRRNDERNKAMNALEEWRVRTDENESSKQVSYNKTRQISSGVTITELPDLEDVPDAKNPDSKSETLKHTSQVRSGVTITELSSSDNDSDSNNIPNSKDTKLAAKKQPKIPHKTPVRSEYVEKKKKEVAKRVLPRLRETAQLEVKHTPRTFPTPSRESAHEEEQAWLKNITLARRATGFVSEDLRPEEQDPQWCKEKGDEFFRCGNFLGAVSAYSHGITLSDKLPSLFANRSATHFALGNFNKCMNDCSTALELMKPACEGNRRSRAKCIARRAAALARCGYLNKAIDEMKAAAKLLPEDETIKKDVFDMERAWEQNPDSD